ncbi:MAG: adenylyltransferase/cytidyltransferase family protein [Planctomycetes bacterium]|nr:adenylyltransferase/cytidyltransferase family protein [Planctomycetota bacterium]
MAEGISRKIVELPVLLDTVAAARAKGQTVVQCHGCFDVVHPGHIRYLEFARRQGDVLVVSLTGDSDISKGDQRPYIPQELRAETLAALEVVDLVYVDPHPTAEHVLEAVRPDIYVKGAEYETSEDPAFLNERAIVQRHQGRVIFSSGDVVFSSTQLIGSMPRQPELQIEALKLICRRHGLTQSSLAETMDRFAGLRVVVVGDVVIDRYVFCDTIDVANESPMMSLARLDEQDYVGGAAIVARHIAALGGQAFLLTAVADDEESDQVGRVLADEGVDCYLIPARRSLARKTRFLVEETKLLKVESGAHTPLDSLAEQNSALILEEQAAQADAVILCDFGYGMITGNLLARTLPVLRRKVPILTADVSRSRSTLLNFVDVDLLTPTEREMRSMLHDFEEGLSSVAWQLLNKTQARHLFVTLGKRGLVVFDRPGQDASQQSWGERLRSEHFPSFADRAVDRLGCGDALLAASTLCLAAGANLIHAAYLGNAAAAIEIGYLGNLPVAAGALRTWLARRPELADVAPAPASTGWPA